MWGALPGQLWDHSHCAHAQIAARNTVCRATEVTQWMGMHFCPFCVVRPSFYLLMSRGTCWATAQTHLADGVNLGTWEGPDTWLLWKGFWEALWTLLPFVKIRL